MCIRDRVNSNGRLGLSSVDISLPDGSTRALPCGALGMSGGWNPNIHITSHHRGRPVWNEEIAAFGPPDNGPAGLSVAGAALGNFTTAGALASGSSQANTILKDLGIKTNKLALPMAEDAPANMTPFWYVEGCSRAWLDQQNDVTVKDVKLSHQENFVSVEHLKRYTTLGMATDQGKTSNMGGLAIMAELTGKTIPEVGTTIFRPPYTPTAIGAFAGRDRGTDFRPTRQSPSHKWAAEQGAVFAVSYTHLTLPTIYSV